MAYYILNIGTFFSMTMYYWNRIAFPYLLLQQKAMCSTAWQAAFHQCMKSVR